MKRLLFVVGCLLLLLAAAAAPASAADKIQWQVIVGPHWSDMPLIVNINYTTMWFSYLDENGEFFEAVPADATDVVVGDAVAFVNRGNMQVFAKSLFQRMTVDDPAGNRVIDIDESESQNSWTPLYHYNDFASIDGPLLPYNPRIGAGMWEKDWWAKLPLDPSTGNPTPGTYTVTYRDLLRHRCADPMFPGRVPGGEGYPPIGGPWGWEDNGGTLYFEVE